MVGLPASGLTVVRDAGSRIRINCVARDAGGRPVSIWINCVARDAGGRDAAYISDLISPPEAI